MAPIGVRLNGGRRVPPAAAALRFLTTNMLEDREKARAAELSG